jgi:hypothetical protein
VGRGRSGSRGTGVGRALLGWTIERASEQLRGSGNEVPKFIRVHRFDYLDSAHRLFRRMGFKPARYFDELIRPLDDLPALDDLPEGAGGAGVTVVPWPDDRERGDPPRRQCGIRVSSPSMT